MKGERPDRAGRASRARCAPTRCRCRRRPASLRHVRHRRRSRRARFNISTAAAHRASRPAACASPSTATDRCRANAAAPTCSRRSASTSAAPPIVERCLNESGIAFLFRADVSSRDAPRGAGAAVISGVRTAFNLLGPADQSCAAGAADRRRAASRADRAARARAAAARVRARVGRARRRRPRRALDDGLHQGVGVPRTGRCKRSTCTRRLRPAEGDARGAARAAMRRRTPAIVRAVLDGEPRAARATSCC